MADRWVDPLARFQGNNAALTEAEILQAKKVFAVYGPDESGTVEAHQLVALLRAMGQTPSFLDMRELQKRLPAAPRLSFQQFLDVYATERKAWDSMEEVMAQLASFDHKGDGTLDSSEMVSALTTLGDVLTEAQCADLLALADQKGRINIVVLSKYLLAQ